MSNQSDFLATFFKNHDVYAEVEVNGFWITQQINGATKKPVYCIYTKESYEKYRAYLNLHKFKKEADTPLF